MKKLICLVLCVLLFASTSSLSLASGETAETEASSTQAPLTLKAVENVGVYYVTQDSVALKWQSEPSAQGYKVYLKNPETKEVIKTLKTQKTSAVFSSLENGTLYEVCVKAMATDENSKMCYSPVSESDFALTAPSEVKTIKTSQADENSVSLYWSEAKGATHYQVWRYDFDKEDFVLCGVTDERSITIYNLESAKIYTFRIRATAQNAEKESVGEFSAYHTQMTQSSMYPTTKAQAAKIYNDAVNQAKERENCVVKYSKTVKTQPQSCSRKAIFSTVKNLASLYNGEVSKTYTFNNSKSGDTTLNSLVLPAGNKSEIRADDIAFFTLKKGESAYWLNITLKKDETSYNGKTTENATHNGRVTKKISVKKLAVSPIIIKNSTQSYDGTVMEAKIGFDGELKKLHVTVPVTMNANCSVSTIEFDTKLDYTIAYSFVFSKVKTEK